jgi:hypothetical protein
MIVYLPVATVYVGSYYVLNMIHVTDIWVFMLLILDVQIVECGNRS